MRYFGLCLVFFALEAFGLTDRPNGAGLPVAEWKFERHEGLIWIRADIGVRPLNFILDSASTMNVIDSETAEELHMARETETIEVRRTDTVLRQSVTKPAGIRVGSLRLPDARLLVLPLGESGGAKKIDGILGLPLFERFLVEVDYSSSKVRLYSNKSHPAPGCSCLPLRFEDGLLGVTLQDPSGRSGNFVMDTGFSGGVVLSSAVGSDYSIRGPSVASILYAGMKIQTRRFSRTTWSVGCCKIDNVETFLCREPGSGLLADKRWSGMVGNRFLSNFKVTFDWAAGRVLLEPAG